MKHTLIVTAFLVSIFLFAQLIGLGLIAKSANVVQDSSGISVSYDDTAIGPRPETEGSGSLLYVLIGIGIGTGFLLLIIKYGKFNLWRIWFFLAVWLATAAAVGAFFPRGFEHSGSIGIAMGLLLAYLKTSRPSVIVHNLTEILMYSGIALIISPLFDVLWGSVLLLAIAAYDMYAVWKSKHMITMAQFQTKAKLFAGLLIPYTAKKEPSFSSSPSSHPSFSSSSPPSLSSSFPAVPSKKIGGKAKSSKKMLLPPVPGSVSGEGEEHRSAVLGGGDIAFPLIFSGIVLGWLLELGFTKASAFMHSAIVTAFATVALVLLFVFAKKDRFYPAMPFLAAGCFFGLFIVWLFTL